MGDRSGIRLSPTPREALTIARILKVNHAGEHGAIRIYRAQIAVSRQFYPDIVGALKGMLDHEVEHCAIFRNAMPARQARPCRIMSLWGVGGSVLEFVTALMGRQAIWMTTAAVEAAVHHHLEDQLLFLETRDRELFSAIQAIRVEEIAHLKTAEANILASTVFRDAFRKTIGSTTDALIWLSTWGDSRRMAREIAQVHP